MKKPYNAMTAQEVQGMDLGPCCICEEMGTACHLVCLDGKCPILGRGWGCLVCDLPCNGAAAVLCFSCLTKLEAGQERLTYICTGHPSRDGRTPASHMHGSHRHCLERHAELRSGFEDK